jgi:hypothetical protein
VVLVTASVPLLLQPWVYLTTVVERVQTAQTV